MRLLDPAFSPRRWERARAVVEEHLRAVSGGLSSIALVDRLTRGGFREEEAVAVLRDMRENGQLQLLAGHWVLADEHRRD